MISLLLIGIVCMGLGMLIARSAPMERVSDSLAELLYNYIDRKTTADNTRVSVGQGYNYDRTEKELIN